MANDLINVFVIWFIQQKSQNDGYHHNYRASSEELERRSWADKGTG